MKWTEIHEKKKDISSKKASSAHGVKAKGGPGEHALPGQCAHSVSLFCVDGSTIQVSCPQTTLTRKENGYDSKFLLAACSPHADTAEAQREVQTEGVWVSSTDSSPDSWCLLV